MPIFFSQFTEIIMQKIPKNIKIIFNIFRILWKGEYNFMHATPRLIYTTFVGR